MSPIIRQTYSSPPDRGSADAAPIRSAVEDPPSLGKSARLRLGRFLNKISTTGPRAQSQRVPVTVERRRSTWGQNSDFADRIPMHVERYFNPHFPPHPRHSGVATTVTSMLWLHRPQPKRRAVRSSWGSSFMGHVPEFLLEAQTDSRPASSSPECSVDSQHPTSEAGPRACSPRALLSPWSTNNGCGRVSELPQNKTEKTGVRNIRSRSQKPGSYLRELASGVMGTGPTRTTDLADSVGAVQTLPSRHNHGRRFRSLKSVDVSARLVSPRSEDFTVRQKLFQLDNSGGRDSGPQQVQLDDILLPFQ